MLLGRAGANQDARASARLRALLIRPNVAPSCDSVQTLTVEFHSVASGCWSCFPHPHRCRRSIAGLSLTIGNHSVRSCCVRTDRCARLLGCVAHRRDSQCFESSRGGLSTSKPVFSFDCMPMLTIEKHRVLSVRRRRYPHPCRHSRHAAAERALALSRRPDGRRDSDDARRSVDIPLPNRLANLCIRTVRAKAAPARRSRAVWISLADIDSSHCGFRR